MQIYAVPERFWIQQYLGYDRIFADFVYQPTFEEHVTEAEKALFKQIPVPSYDDNAYGLIRTKEYIDTKVEQVLLNEHRLSTEEGKRLGDGELNHQKQILLRFMAAQTDPGARNMSSVIPNSVPSGLPVEASLTANIINGN